MSKEKKTEEEQKIHVEFIKQLVTLSTSGFGLVAALAWNNVIKEFVDTYVKKWLPEGSGFTSLLIYAIAITALAVIVTLQLSKILRRVENEK